MKIMVSACLIGENVKYNGGNNFNEKVAALAKDNEIIPVCPEMMGGMPCPRKPGEIVNGIVRNQDGTAVDFEYRSGAAKALELAREKGIDLAILQSRSPSCGVNLIYDGSFSGQKIPGHGVFADLLIKNGFNVMDVEDMENMMETQRLILRPWRETDAKALFKYASDPDVGPRAGWSPHENVEESLAIIKTIFMNTTMWAVELKETHEAIGCVGYLPAQFSNLEIPDNHAEVGYWIGKPYWGKGICTEAMKAVIDYCFNEKGYETLWGDFFPENPASGKVMEKCGFKDTGRTVTCPNLIVGADRPVKVMKLNRKD